MRNLLVGVVLTALASIAVPVASAQAATCDDYINQADAQRAADTIDADGDGIYCEALPCPCLGKPGTRDPQTEAERRRDAARKRRVAERRKAEQRRAAERRRQAQRRRDAARRRREQRQRLADRRARARWEGRRAVVVRVLDGDTVIVRVFGRDQPVSLVGIRAPGVGACGAPEAARALEVVAFKGGTAYLPRQGKTVTIRTDRAVRPRVGGTLHAYLDTEDAIDLGVAQVAFGFADTISTDAPLKRATAYSRARALAAAQRRGVYALCPGGFEP